MVVSHEKVRQAFQYLLDAGKVHSQQDLADAMNKNKSYVSRHLNNEDGASDVFVREMCVAFPGIFNLNFFLASEGSMLVEKKPTQDHPTDNAIMLQLLKMMEQRDERITRLEDEVALLRASVAKLERAHYGYASIAADGGK